MKMFWTSFKFWNDKLLQMTVESLSIRFYSLSIDLECVNDSVCISVTDVINNSLYLQTEVFYLHVGFDLSSNDLIINQSSKELRFWSEDIPQNIETECLCKYTTYYSGDNNNLCNSQPSKVHYEFEWNDEWSLLSTLENCRICVDNSNSVTNFACEFDSTHSLKSFQGINTNERMNA